MSRKPQSGSGGRRGVLTAVAAACTLSGTALLALGFTSHDEPPPVPKTAERGPAGQPAPTPPPHSSPSREATAVLPASPPTAIGISRIGLEADVTRVALNEAGTIAMPGDADDSGWYTGSPAPGTRGNSILVGHVDSRSGPAAFYGLGAVEDGDRITVERADGRTVAYVVDGLHVWPKDDFPSQRVYGPTGHPRLTLLTCADWDDDEETYRSNLVVTAHLRCPACPRPHLGGEDRAGQKDADGGAAEEAEQEVAAPQVQTDGGGERGPSPTSP
ncbi:sortase domain-containing protein [Streptomyces gossypii]|uniref:sortase domain-containing protein n=1 Tax=Streptomyces gossypii TaxID=2883101 RepID=UPI0035CD2BED